MEPTSPPDAHYLHLGRVTAAFAMLDIQMGMIGRAAKTGEAWTENWSRSQVDPVKLSRRALRRRMYSLRNWLIVSVISSQRQRASVTSGTD